MYFLNFNDGFVEVPFASPSLNIYTVGCEHKCKGCHAKDLQNFNHEKREELTFELIKKKLNLISGFYKSVCWLGGDPFFQFDECYNISLKIKNEFPNIINVVFTGYKWDKFFKEHLNKIDFRNIPFDYVIDGAWNGKMLGQDGCNQKIWFKNKLLSNIFGYQEIFYNDYKIGKFYYEKNN